MKRAALLLRCSTDSQDYDRQLRDLQPTAEHMGYIIEKDLIFGEYITGKDDVRKKDRESIANLKLACKEGKVDAIFINEVSRLSRDSIAGRLFIREFNEDYRVPIFFRDLQQWTINPISKNRNAYLEQMLGFYFDAASAELKSMKTRFASGKRKNARTGKSIGGVPSIGYTKDKDGTIIIDEENSKLIKIIFDKYLEKDGTITTVGRYLRGISNISTSSFAFTIDNDKWEKRNDGTYLRRITKFKELFDVSPVYKEAYPDTSVACRKMQELDNEELKNYYEELRKGL